jgi:histone acetyltransferase (RNA polymerase elongator complex component)
MKPFVIPVFISHQGCPHRCIFCDQHTITGQNEAEGQPVTPGSVRKTIEDWLCLPRKKRRQRVQVAFYGGSFTGLPYQRQVDLLESVQPYIASGEVDCIRISTRPDYIDDVIIALLKEYSVAIVELGIQSLNQEVLTVSFRGHSVQQSEDAIIRLKMNGFKVGAQLMCGLPGDNRSRLLATAGKTAALGPDFVRIYPALVIKGSGLEKLYREGKYTPLSLARAIALSARMKNIFDEHGIKVVRIGLQPSAELAERVVAGPYHPAFGELVLARNIFKKTRKLLHEKEGLQKKSLHIAKADESVFRGPNNAAIKRLTKLGLMKNVELVFDKNLARNTVGLF